MINKSKIREENQHDMLLSNLSDQSTLNQSPFNSYEKNEGWWVKIWEYQMIAKMTIDQSKKNQAKVRLQLLMNFDNICQIEYT